MNNKIFVHYLNPNQKSNRKLHKAFVFSLHFLSKFMNKNLPDWIIDICALLLSIFEILRVKWIHYALK